MHRFFTRWRKQGLTGELPDRLRATREAEGRGAELTAGLIDSQSTKDTSTVEAATGGMSSTSTCAAAERDDVAIAGPGVAAGGHRAGVAVGQALPVSLVDDALPPTEGST